MKSLLTFSFLFLFFQISFSQDWALFPEGQKTYWEANGEFYLYYNDVTFPGGFTNKHYFGAEYLTEDSVFQCYKDILENEYQLDEAPIDSIFSTPFYWFDFLGNDEIRFYHLTEPGGNWTIVTTSISGVDSIVFSCVSKNEETFFGVTDSVKTFTLQGYKNGNPISDFNSVEYKLSKKNGLLKFVPLRMLGSQMIEYDMMGFDDGQERGFTSSWEDFFGKFEVGQILSWRYDRERIFLPIGYWKATEFFSDSITYVDFTETKLSIGVSRNAKTYMLKNGNNDYYNFDSIGFYHIIDTLNFYRISFQAAMDAPPGWLKFDHESGVVPFHYEAKVSGWQGPFYSYNTYYSIFDTLVCAILTSDPSSLPTTISAGLGLTHWGLIGGLYGEYYEYTLAGYKKGGESFGNFFNFVNPVFSRPTPNLSFKLFPNPTTDELNIVFPDELNVQNLELKITDVAGNIILSEKTKKGFGKIDVSSFPPGIYFFVINGEGVWGRERFVKF
jgi:hypothetical protein